MIRIGLVGCGFIAAIHSRALKALRDGGLVDAEVVATCDPDPGRAEAFARAHRAELATDDLGRVLEAVDAVYVCTPTAAQHSRPDIRFVPVTGLPASIFGLAWVKGRETAAVRAFNEAAVGQAATVEALVA